MPASNLARRQFLHLGALAAGLAVPATAWACGPVASGQPSPPPNRPPVAPGPGASAATASCAITETNIEGPYYRAGAPLRSNLVDADVVGVPLLLTGRVLSLDCRSSLADAELDIWHADGRGHYDNDGSLRLPADRFRLRGRVKTDKSGAFSLRTVVPGRYLNGRTYRPAHVHVKVRAAGHRALTTQLYFPGDPYNEADAFIRRSLIMDLASAGDGKQARFDFVLPPAG
jgi:protocatechuate 3,4-dioxygenase beta subunit